MLFSGDLLNIEFRDGGEPQSWKVTVGRVDWSGPSGRVHRAVNVGQEVFEEMMTFWIIRTRHHNLRRPEMVPHSRKIA